MFIVKMEKETKEKIIEELEGIKEYEVLFKFSDVYWEVKAKSKEEAEQKAQDYLDKNSPKKETYCYEFEVDVLEE